MIPEARNTGQAWRAAVAALALAVTAFIIHAIFTSGFGRPPRPAVETPEPVAAATPPAGRTDPFQPDGGADPSQPGGGAPSKSGPSAAAEPARVVVPQTATLAVISDDFWLTYLPRGLERSGGGVIQPEPGVEGGWARFGSADRFVEAQVEHGVVAADWQSYRSRVTVLDARDTTVRGKPAVVGRHPSGGRLIVWLERVGTGAWIRVSESLGKELVAVAASVKAPVGD
ncbi:hypothetical protein [Nonomuraea basaltis]|uniref:hypothetical protein n=1 Tax=Nonomuraea basaltis TaxID=2495887 RepID=UPI00110C6EAB|nr:hypothetical protein [Nonomuraea basaltis]TMR89459.1 hypothetical protein EJK15_60725 [Nonomuraea basaltis]